MKEEYGKALDDKGAKIARRPNSPEETGTLHRA